MTIGVYKLKHKLDATKFYIGSTNNIKSRMVKHKSKVKLCQPNHCKLYKTILEDGWDNYECEVLKEFPEDEVNTEMRISEQDYINELKPTLNTRAALLTEAQRLAAKHDSPETNIVCECGSTITRSHISRHRSTIKHLEYILNCKIKNTSG